MRSWTSRNFKKVPAVFATLFLLIILGCGSSATATPGPVVVPTATITVPSSTPIPTSAPLPTVIGPTATTAPQIDAKPAGTLNVGLLALGPYMGNPKLAGNPQIGISLSAPITETLLMHDEIDGTLIPMLAAEWSISEDGLICNAGSNFTRDTGR